MQDSHPAMTVMALAALLLLGIALLTGFVPTSAVSSLFHTAISGVLQ